MSGRFTLRGVECYLPKRRIRRKVEKPEYRERYERWCRTRGIEANYNSHEKLCWVELSQTGIANG